MNCTIVYSTLNLYKTEFLRKIKTIDVIAVEKRLIYSFLKTTFFFKRPLHTSRSHISFEEPVLQSVSTDIASNSNRTNCSNSEDVIMLG